MGWGSWARHIAASRSATGYAASAAVLSATLARTLELDRESIERRDFPLARRGYDPAAVDAHLRALAQRTQELAQCAAAAAEPSLGTTAATQVQGILEAAQATAAVIEREAQRDAQRLREDAALEVEGARTHVETLARASAGLLASVESLDGEVSALAQSLRDGRPPPAPVVVAEERQSLTPPAPAPAPQAGASGQGGEDLDGARLVALNMALGGESREQTDRYLADSYQLADRAKLLDEVYAAIEG
jgi:DivIVA domain-containing protein